MERLPGTLAGFWRRGVGRCNLCRLIALVVPLAGALGGRWEVEAGDPLVASSSRGPNGLNPDPPGFPKWGLHLPLTIHLAVLEVLGLVCWLPGEEPLSMAAFLQGA